MARKPRGRPTHNTSPQSIPDNAPRDAAVVEFANRLQRAMVDKGWNQSELARQAGIQLGREIGRDSVSQYVRGVSFPNPERLGAIARALGKEVSDLMPTRGVRSAASINEVAFSVSDNGDGTSWVRVNQAVDSRVALKIWSLLQEDERLRAHAAEAHEPGPETS